MTENFYEPNSIRLFSGRYLNLESPDVKDINILDIAVGLSRQCRFGGHTKNFYSVARHSISVSNQSHEKDKLVGLLHDSPEAYIRDFPKSLKSLVPGYQKIENKLFKAIETKFELKDSHFAKIKLQDLESLEQEWEQEVINRPSYVINNQFHRDCKDFLNTFQLIIGETIYYYSFTEWNNYLLNVHQKRFYDIVSHDGNFYTSMYPNGEYFTSTTDPKSYSVLQSHVKYIRLSNDQFNYF